jgi:crossover junction endodeoxyribonuclease RuvC
MTVILGIDPGSRTTGYGVIQEVNKALVYIDSGCIKTDTTADFSIRLLQIFNGILEVIRLYNPSEVAIEQVFMHQNPNSALKLGHARGAAIVACATHKLKMRGYAPRLIKQAVVGYGAAQKPQVKQMVQSILMLNKAPQTDAADALAIAICHSYMKSSMLDHLLKGNVLC